MADFEIKDSVLKKYHGKGGDVIIPDSITEIYVWAFIGRKDITSITFPDSLVKIGERAFFGCTGLTELNLPNSLEEIGREAFAKCTGLTSICIPPSVNQLGFYAFHDCPALKHIVAPANVLNDWPFPRTVESAELISGHSLSQGAFADFKALRSVTLPATLERIGKEAFLHCTALRELVLPDSVTNICNGAFKGCTALETVAMGASLCRIEEEAFKDCSALTSIHIPATTVRIETNAFAGCQELTSCSFGDLDRWCRVSPLKLWHPYDAVEGIALDLADPQANAAIVRDLSETVLFKKRAVPRPEPAKPRFLTQVAERAEDGIFAQGRFFAYITPDEDTTAALWEQAAQLSVARTEVTEHDHDEYGRYTDVETTYHPLINYRGLAAPYSGCNADIVVEDGKIIGLLFCRVFYGNRDAYDDCFIFLPNTPEEENRSLILLWADGQVVGDNLTSYHDHSGRDFTDSDITYKLVKSAGDKTERHASWR